MHSLINVKFDLHWVCGFLRKCVATFADLKLFAQVLSGMCVCGVLGAYGAEELPTATYLPLICLPLRKGT